MGNDGNGGGVVVYTIEHQMDGGGVWYNLDVSNWQSLLSQTQATSYQYIGD